MKTPFEPSRLLDRGGKPTVRELLSRLVFNPTDGTIRLNGDRVVMQRAAVGVELRRELIRLLGPQEARIFLMRLGFLSGQADARFVRTSWPSLDIGDAFTAGTRLHTFSGVVRVETIYNDFDFRKKRFAGEFLWHDSVEAAEFRRLRRKTTEPVCWTQLGYASGYASEFFETLIVYKEVACSAAGASPLPCGGKAGRWLGAARPGSDPVSGTHRATSEDGPGRAAPEGCRSAPPRARITDLDRLILAPVREELDRLAPMALPVMITGSPGTGRSRAAQLSASRLGHGGKRCQPCFRSAGRPRLLRRDRAPRQRRASGRCRRNDPDRRRRESPDRRPAASRPRDRGRDGGRRAAHPGAGGIRSGGRPCRSPAIVSRTLVRAVGLDDPHAAACRAQGRQRLPLHRRLHRCLRRGWALHPPQFDALGSRSHRARGLARQPSADAFRAWRRAGRASGCPARFGRRDRGALLRSRSCAAARRR